MKKFDFNLVSFQRNNRNTSWQKALVLALAITTGIIVVAYSYLLIKPVSSSIQALIDEEISAVDINFDKKTIENIKERQRPTGLTTPKGGKNPFAE